MRVQQRTGSDTTLLADTMLVELTDRTDSLITMDGRRLRVAIGRQRDLEGGWTDKAGLMGWETRRDSLILVEQNYGYGRRSATPLLPFDGAGTFGEATHVGGIGEGAAWLRTRNCTAPAP